MTEQDKIFTRQNIRRFNRGKASPALPNEVVVMTILMILFPNG